MVRGRARRRGVAVAAAIAVVPRRRRGARRRGCVGVEGGRDMAAARRRGGGESEMGQDARRPGSADRPTLAARGRTRATARPPRRPLCSLSVRTRALARGLQATDRGSGARMSFDRFDTLPSPSFLPSSRHPLGARTARARTARFERGTYRRLASRRPAGALARPPHSAALTTAWGANRRDVHGRDRRWRERCVSAADDDADADGQGGAAALCGSARACARGGTGRARVP